jgi:hypothetical protein
MTDWTRSPKDETLIERCYDERGAISPAQILSMNYRVHFLRWKQDVE